MEIQNGIAFFQAISADFSCMYAEWRKSSSGKVEQERLDFKDTLLTPDNPDIVGTHNPDNQDIPSKEKVDKKGKGGDQPRAWAFHQHLPKWKA